MDAPTQIRGFSKLKSFVHILVGRGLSALSISYILSSVFDKEAEKLFKVLDAKLSNMEEEDVDGDNIIPNSIKCIIGKTYIF
ncbi:hypothetical protein RGQ29_002127 [Quercus rubra]|uniref:Uncharacterized protein n=1 Tax=Quercus rubra TaxID=3512 RepID=A0AAN7G8T4_QUERU|nr:hypothetical protein RGQ29_002127 [Quercus rubra]